LRNIFDKIPNLCEAQSGSFFEMERIGEILIAQYCHAPAPVEVDVMLMIHGSKPECQETPKILRAQVNP
jgi:hypothetical protein